MKLFGLELEAFCEIDGTIKVPSKAMPVDGFAGLVEIRSIVSSDPYEVYGDVVQKKLKLEKEFGCALVLKDSYKFNADELKEIRKNTQAPAKAAEVEINNLYGKRPKLLAGGLALASLQINISERLTWAVTHTQFVDKIPVRFEQPATYGLLDIPQLVRKLDMRFGPCYIDPSKRTRGWYAVKDGIRLEYRSLPNWAFGDEIPAFLEELK